MCTIEGNNGIIAATGTTTPHTVTAVFACCAKRFHRHYSGQRALLNRYYRETNSAVIRKRKAQAGFLMWERVRSALTLALPLPVYYFSVDIRLPLLLPCFCCYPVSYLASSALYSTLEVRRVCYLLCPRGRMCVKIFGLMLCLVQ